MRETGSGITGGVIAQEIGQRTERKQRGGRRPPRMRGVIHTRETGEGPDLADLGHLAAPIAAALRRAHTLVLTPETATEEIAEATAKANPIIGDQTTRNKVTNLIAATLFSISIPSTSKNLTVSEEIH